MTLRGVPEGDPATHRRKRYVDATGRGLALLGVLFVLAYTVYVLWPDRPSWVTTAQLSAPLGQNQTNGIRFECPFLSKVARADSMMVSTVKSTGQRGKAMRSHPLRRIFCRCLRTATDKTGRRK